MRCISRAPASAFRLPAIGGIYRSRGISSEPGQNVVSDDPGGQIDRDAKYVELTSQLALIAEIDGRTKQGTLGMIAMLPAIMCVAYLLLIGYMRKMGGYVAREITEPT